MFPARSIFGFALFMGLLVLLGPAARGQDDDDKKKKEKEAFKALLDKADEEYRVFFRRPEKVHEFWAAMKFEIEVGKFDLAALHLKQLLAKEPPDEVDRELFKVEEVEGMGAFLRLQTIRKWSDHKPFQEEAEKNVDLLIERLSKIVEKSLSDPVRINKFIKRLDAPTVEERAFALVQLKRARERAAPYLVEALRLNAGKSLHDRIVDAIVRLDSEIVPPLLEILKAKDAKDAEETDLRPTILNIMRRRADKRAVPYLWHLSSAPIYPAQVRKQAEKMLAEFLETDIDKLPPAKFTLTEMADRYYQHKVRFASKSIRFWRWDGRALAKEPIVLTPSQAEEFFGLRYALEAIDLDQAYQPAQMVFLSLMLERTVAPRLDQTLLTPMGPKLQNLLATIDPDLLTKVLERAMDEHKIPVILPAVQALGERGDTRAAKLGAGGAPRGLVRALYYPDRRVQYAALKAMLKMPATPVPVASVRMVDILQRFLSASDNPKAIAAYVPQEKANEIRQAIKEVGLEPVLVKNVKSALEEMKNSADFDVVFLFLNMTPQELPYILNQFRSDADSGGLPILIFAPKDKVEWLEKAAQRYSHVNVYPDIWLEMKDELKDSLEAHVKASAGARLSPEERKEFRRVALDKLWRMARGEIQGYDLRPALDAITRTLRDPESSTEALEILGRMPGPSPQARLAREVLDAGSKSRVTAALELNRSIQKFGLLLDKHQSADLRAAYRTEGDQALKTQLALVMGSMRSSPQATGHQLTEFQPDPPPPPPEKKDKGKEKEKEKG